MKRSSDLVDALVAELRPAPRSWLRTRLATGFLAGGSVSAAATLSLWGPRPDLAAAAATWPFWAKLGFVGLLAAAGVAAVARFARPELAASRAVQVAVATLAGMAVLATTQYASAPPPARSALVLGKTAAACPWLIMALAVPVFAGGVWAMRALAPTQLASAGAALGLASGAGAAAVYAISCDEVGMPFVLLWYGLGIAVPSLVGGLLGRRLLRW